jgi:site-specific DNA-methyltransferase (cytosine-N4-specific)
MLTKSNLGDGPTTETVQGLLDSKGWDFDSSTRDPIHDIHPYPARFIPEIPRQLLTVFHPPQDGLVLDVFAGSGTTLLEANRAGYDACGIDLQPVACLISRVKTGPVVACGEAARVVSERSLRLNAKVPDIPRLDHWFKPDVQMALARLTSLIATEQDVALRDALSVALSRIIVRVSNQESDTRYAAIEKSVDGDLVHSLFVSSADSLEAALSQRDLPPLTDPTTTTVINSDVLAVSPAMIPGPVAMAITSPPYPNAYEYWLYHKYRAYWLGYDPLFVRANEIGARPHFFRRNGHTAADFETQMAGVFRLLEQTMVPSGLACFVVGDSVIHGEVIDNLALLSSAAATHGFRLAGQIDRQVKLSKKSFNLKVSRLQSERIAVFEAPS